MDLKRLSVRPRASTELSRGPHAEGSQRSLRRWTEVLRDLLSFRWRIPFGGLLALSLILVYYRKQREYWNKQHAF
jgi:hypothetical protein